MNPKESNKSNEVVLDISKYSPVNTAPWHININQESRLAVQNKSPFRDLEEAAKYNIPNIQKQDMKLWRLANPIRYREVKNYLSHEVLAAALIRASKEHQDSSFHASLLANLGAPTWWVGMDIGRALLQTTLPSGLSISSMSLPLDHFALLLPRGLMPYGEDGDSIAILAFGYIDGEIFRTQLTEASIKIGKANDYIESIIDGNWAQPGHKRAFYHGQACIYGWSFNGAAFGGKPDPTDDLESISLRCMDEGASEDDQYFGNYLYSFVLNCAFVISQRPDLLDDGSNEKLEGASTPITGGKHLASPRWVGKHYVRRERGVLPPGSHASPSVHWRRGHWRRQVIGQREMGARKVIWIEPVLVGSNDTGDDFNDKA